MLQLNRYRTAFYCLVGVCVAAVLLNITSLYIWENKSATKSRDKISHKHSHQASHQNSHKHSNKEALSHTKTPVVLWWTDFLHDPGSVQQCADVSCFFTNNRSYITDPATQMILFYGTSLELHDLPLPRQPRHQWGIIHEESPKNNWAFSNDRFMSLFNYTATFRRSSDFPLTLIWLSSIEALESRKHYHTVEEKNMFMKELDLAPIAYIQSDCGAPSDRDQLVKLLSKHINIDSLGKCLNNKKLPEHLQDNLAGMDHIDFYDLLSKYKFVIAAENAVCEDYITEKLWRSFYVGTIPIVYGSPSIKDWLPSADSAIVVNDFGSVKSLASFIQQINSNDTAYAYYTRYKHSGVSNVALLKGYKERSYSAIGSFDGRPSFSIAVQCDACKRLHMLKKPGLVGSHQHHSCPAPLEFSEHDSSGLLKKPSDWFAQEYIYRQYQSNAFLNFLERGANWTYLDLYKLAYQGLAKDRPEFVTNGIISTFKRYADSNVY